MQRLEFCQTECSKLKPNLTNSQQTNVLLWLLCQEAQQLALRREAKLLQMRQELRNKGIVKRKVKIKYLVPPLTTSVSLSFSSQSLIEGIA